MGKTRYKKYEHINNKKENARLTPLKNKYVVHNRKICLRKGSAKKEFTYTPICNFTAEIVEQIKKDDGWKIQHLFSIQGKDYKNKPFPTIIVDYDQFFADVEWVKEKWGPRAAVYKGKEDHLHSAIRYLSKNIQHRQIYTHIGWNKEDTWEKRERIFVTANGLLGFDNGAEIEIKGNLKRYSLPLKPQNTKKALAASLRFLDVAPLAVTVPIWAAMYLAPLNPLFPLDTISWLCGMGDEKSALAALALSHFGKFTKGKLPATWDTEPERLEKMLYLAKDVPFVIDGFSPQNTAESRRLEKKASKIVRLIEKRNKTKAELRSEVEQSIENFERNTLDKERNRLIALGISASGSLLDNDLVLGNGLSGEYYQPLTPERQLENYVIYQAGEKFMKSLRSAKNKGKTDCCEDLDDIITAEKKKILAILKEKKMTLADYLHLQLAEKYLNFIKLADRNLDNPYQPGGLILSTGERLPKRKRIMPYIFRIDINSKDVDIQKLTKAQADAHLYSHAMAAYVQWLDDHWGTIVHEMPFLTEFELQGKFGKSYNSSIKIYNYLYYAIWLALMFFVNKSVITFDTFIKMENEYTKILRQIINPNSKKDLEENLLEAHSRLRSGPIYRSFLPICMRRIFIY